MELPKKIISQRLILKYPEPTFELAKQVYKVMDKSRNTLREWLDWVDKTNSPEDEYNGFFMIQKKHREEKSGFGYIIYHKETKKILGSVDLMNISEKKKSGEIGFWLSDDAVGHGYMLEAVIALEGRAFKEGLNRIYIRNDTKNIRSIHVAQKAKYVLDGVMRQDFWDNYHKCFRDTNVWSKLRAEWKVQQRD